MRYMCEKRRHISQRQRTAVNVMRAAGASKQRSPSVIEGLRERLADLIAVVSPDGITFHESSLWRSASTTNANAGEARRLA